MKNLTTYCKDFEITPAIDNYVKDKLSSLYKYLNQDEENVIFNLRMGKVSNNQLNGKIFYAEVSIHTPEKNFGARIEAQDIYEAIDLLKDDLAENITQYKNKSRTVNLKQAQKFKEQLHSAE